MKKEVNARFLRPAACGLGLLLLVMAGGCKEQKARPAEAKKATDSVQPASNILSAGPPRLGNELLDAIYPSYTQLQDALVAGSVTDARLAASSVEAGARALPGGGSLALEAGRILNSSNISVQRAAFARMNDQLVRMARQSGMRSGTLYVAHCPMARDNEGASWLTPDREIRNPYYGSDMLTCGVIKDTIRAAHP